MLDSEESFVVRMESPCEVLWRPEALDCGVLIPPEGAWSGLTRHPQSEIRTPDLLHLTSDAFATELSGPLRTVGPFRNLFV